MKLLLDTHALLWWLSDDDKLSYRARELIANPTNQVVVSSISGWEASIKKALGKLTVDLDRLSSEVANNGFTLLDTTFRHGVAAGSLPSHHRDPFDRMLIAQAQCEGLKLVSIDSCFADYDVDVVW